MKYLKRMLLSLSCFLLLAIPTFGLSVAYAAADAPAADPTDPATSSVCSAIHCDESQGPSIGSILKVVLNILTFLVGFAAIIMIIFNSFRFVTSGGDSSKVASARSGIFYALIGIAIAALAQIMVHFVINQINSKATITPPTAAQCKQKPKPAHCP